MKSSPEKTKTLLAGVPERDTALTTSCAKKLPNTEQAVTKHADEDADKSSRLQLDPGVVDVDVKNSGGRPCETRKEGACCLKTSKGTRLLLLLSLKSLRKQKK